MIARAGIPASLSRGKRGTACWRKAYSRPLVSSKVPFEICGRKMAGTPSARALIRRRATRALGLPIPRHLAPGRLSQLLSPPSRAPTSLEPLSPRHNRAVWGTQASSWQASSADP